VGFKKEFLKIMDINKDIQDIINYAHSFAEKMLVEFGEFYPFGASISSDGELIPFGFKDDESDMPKSENVIEQLAEYFTKQLDNNEIRAYGIAYDVLVQPDESSQKTNAILVEIFHQDDKDIPEYYFPYSFAENGELIFGESFAMEK
jgi:hypothetical protein